MADSGVYLKLDGIKGPVTTAGHLGEIAVRRASFATSSLNHNPFLAPGPTILSVTLEKDIDVTSPALHKALANSGAIAEGYLTFKTPGQSKPGSPAEPDEVWKIAIANIYIGSIRRSREEETVSRNRGQPAPSPPDDEVETVKLKGRVTSIEINGNKQYGGVDWGIQP